MEALTESTPRRRRRYTRQPVPGRFTLTPAKVQLLHYVAEFGIASLPQLAVLTSPSQKSARRALRDLFDRGLVEVIPVARVALADPEELGDPALLYGSAPNLYSVTREGLKLLHDLDLAEEIRKPRDLRGRGSYFLAHELFVRDVRVWLERAAQEHPDQRLERWRDGVEAEIDLAREAPPKAARPDAWFVYRLGTRVLVGLVEVDRGTERGTERWTGKLAAYSTLFGTERLRLATGYEKARVLVVAPDERRRDRLTSLIEEHGEVHAARFWLAARSVLGNPDLRYLGWRQAGSRLLKPLLPPGLFGGPEGEGHAATSEIPGGGETTGRGTR